MRSSTCHCQVVSNAHPHLQHLFLLYMILNTPRTQVRTPFRTLRTLAIPALLLHARVSISTTGLSTL